MSNLVNDYFTAHYAPIDGEAIFIFPRMECADGFNMSVQGHRGAYCNPRVEFRDAGEYYEVEVGFPSAREELLMEHAEDAEQPTKTVYGYVPVDVVAAVVAKHGGLK